MMGFGMMGGGFFGLFGIIIIGLVVYLFVRNSNNRGYNFDNERKDPLEILDERYARGEISEMEYEERKRILKDLVLEGNCG